MQLANNQGYQPGSGHGGANRFRSNEGKNNRSNEYLWEREQPK